MPTKKNGMYVHLYIHIHQPVRTVMVKHGIELEDENERKEFERLYEKFRQHYATWSREDLLDMVAYEKATLRWRGRR